MTVYGRTPQRTKVFVEECGVTAAAHCVGADTPPSTQEESNPPPHKPTLSAAAWEDRGRRRGEVLVNCTPVGMWPKVDESPIPADSLGGCRLVFDLIYRPLQTQLLHDATTAGCVTLNGLDMFIRQAAMQFELWTGRTPDLQQARDLVTRGIHPP
jgi:3-dehydroquinate dehydratase/shikimate dehydrogenase